MQIRKAFLVYAAVYLTRDSTNNLFIDIIIRILKENVISLKTKVIVLR